MVYDRGFYLHLGGHEVAPLRRRVPSKRRMLQPWTLATLLYGEDFNGHVAGH